jgi:hypothetical protein
MRTVSGCTPHSSPASRSAAVSGCLTGLFGACHESPSAALVDCAGSLLEDHAGTCRVRQERARGSQAPQWLAPREPMMNMAQARWAVWSAWVTALDNTSTR